MSVLERTKQLIEKGRSNTVHYIPTGIEKLDEHTDGITQGTYIVVGAETTVGKTAFARDKYIHTAFEYYKKVNDPTKLDVLFVDLTLEIIPEINLAGAMTRKLFFDYGRVIPPKKILKSLSDENLQIVNSFDEYFKEFNSKCIVVDEDVTPGKYHDLLMEVAKRHGTFTKEARFISECGEYVPNNPNLFVQVILDTINLAEMDSGHNTIKSTIDRISRISVWFRNKCKFSFVVLQQFHGDLSTTERRKHGSITPKLTDLEDSKRPSKDADIVLGLYDPIRHMTEDQSMFRGYDMTILKSWYRSLHILKNRRGENNKVIDLKFDGAVGYFTQLPLTKDMDEMKYRLATQH